MCRLDQRQRLILLRRFAASLRRSPAQLLVAVAAVGRRLLPLQLPVAAADAAAEQAAADDGRSSVH